MCSALDLCCRSVPQSAEAINQCRICPRVGSHMVCWSRRGRGMPTPKENKGLCSGPEYFKAWERGKVQFLIECFEIYRCIWAMFIFQNKARSVCPVFVCRCWELFLGVSSPELPGALGLWGCGCPWHVPAAWPSPCLEALVRTCTFVGISWLSQHICMVPSACTHHYLKPECIYICKNYYRQSPKFNYSSVRILYFTEFA